MMNNKSKGNKYKLHRKSIVRKKKRGYRAEKESRKNKDVTQLAIINMQQQSIKLIRAMDEKNASDLIMEGNLNVKNKYELFPLRKPTLLSETNTNIQTNQLVNKGISKLDDSELVNDTLIDSQIYKNNNIADPISIKDNNNSIRSLKFKKMIECKICTEATGRKTMIKEATWIFHLNSFKHENNTKKSNDSYDVNIHPIISTRDNVNEEDQIKVLTNSNKFVKMTNKQMVNLNSSDKDKSPHGVSIIPQKRGTSDGTLV